MSEKIGILVIYLPPQCGKNPQWKSKRSRWSPFGAGTDGRYETPLPDLPEGTEIFVRYTAPDGASRPIAPISGCENLNGRFFTIGALPPSGEPSPAQPARGRICLEVSLEALLPNFAGGIHAATDIADLTQRSISERILDSGIPRRLAALEIDEIMAPVFPSVANRTDLNPKFNYLTYAVGEVDWQLGRPKDFKRLVHALGELGISLVPDMIFAHFVKEANPASLDSIRSADGKMLFVDAEAFLFRDYGTWMYNLGNESVRRILRDKIVGFIRDYCLGVIRIDYIDGLILQYSRRAENFGEIFLDELNAGIRALECDVTVVGEAFSTQGNPVVRRLLDVMYCPRGFSLVEEIYRPPFRTGRPLHVDVDKLAEEINRAMDSPGREAIYAQLHDECWTDPHISTGRPSVPWAYGANAAELVRRNGLELVNAGLLASRDLLDFTRRRVRAAESLTMFLARLRYLFTPFVDSLSLGSLDEPGRWRMEWDDPEPEDMRTWKLTGLTDAEVFRAHDQHRIDMRKLRSIWRRLTPIDPVRQLPILEVRTLHYDQRTSVYAMLRRNPSGRRGAHIIVWNFGPHRFFQETAFEVCIPEDLVGQWIVVFDGDNHEDCNRPSGERRSGYEKDAVLSTQDGEFAHGRNVLRIQIGANSMLVLEIIS